MSALTILKPDRFTLAMLTTVAVATFLPCRGAIAQVFGVVTVLAIGLLFFMHGAKLSREAIVSGLAHWRLHLVVLGATFVLFPVLGLLVRWGSPPLLPAGLAAGVLFLSLLPSTVQSSIAFTSIAGGNIPAAVCSASASNLIGIFVTPALAALLLGGHGAAVSLKAVTQILAELLAPFIVGHLMRPLIGEWIGRNKSWLGVVDRSSILLVVFTAFSAAVVEGLWSRVSPSDLLRVFLVDGAVLAILFAVTTFGARAMGFSREDEITIVFCGSKKSLASGAPMASVLFAPALVGTMIVPLMIFHQMQLMACAALARRYAAGGSRLTSGGVHATELPPPEQA